MKEYKQKEIVKENIYSRRNFLRTTGSVLGAGMVFPSAAHSLYTENAEMTEKPQWLVDLITLNDTRFDDYSKFLKENRINDESHPDFGGFLDNNFRLPTANATGGFIQNALCSLISPESRYYHSEMLLQTVTEASFHLLRTQHDDGTVDLISHNFYSPPDTAFRVMRLAPLFSLLRDERIPGSEDAVENIETFLKNASRPLLDGGIHTPNHRWVFCAALGRMYQLWPDEKYRERADAWLAEGIDIDEDGQYRERDLIYSAVSNRALVITAKTFDKPELYEYVRKNLDLTLYLLTSTGELTEEVSERVERQGRNLRIPTSYYFPYRYMAIHDNDGRYAAMCRHIERTHFNQISGSLYYMIVDKNLWKTLPPTESLPRHFVKELTGSEMVRIRRGNYDASIISRFAKQGIFFTYHKPDAVLWGMRLGNSFSGMGQFVPDEIYREGDEWVLTRKVDGLYFQPLPEEYTPLGMDWEYDPEYHDEYGLMWSTANRELTRIHTLSQSARIREIEDGFEVDITVDGTANVPTAVELIFRPGGYFSGVDKHEQLDDTYYLKEGYGRYHAGRSTIKFGPGTFGHISVDMRGTLPKMDLPTVVLTGVTPYNQTIRIT